MFVTVLDRFDDDDERGPSTIQRILGLPPAGAARPARPTSPPWVKSTTRQLTGSGTSRSSIVKHIGVSVASWNSPRDGYKDSRPGAGSLASALRDPWRAILECEDGGDDDLAVHLEGAPEAPVRTRLVSGEIERGDGGDEILPAADQAAAIRTPKVLGAEADEVRSPGIEAAHDLDGVVHAASTKVGMPRSAASMAYVQRDGAIVTIEVGGHEECGGA